MSFPCLRPLVDLMTGPKPLCGWYLGWKNRLCTTSHFFTINSIGPEPVRSHLRPELLDNAGILELHRTWIGPVIRLVILAQKHTSDYCEKKVCLFLPDTTRPLFQFHGCLMWDEIVQEAVSIVRAVCHALAAPPYRGSISPAVVRHRSLGNVPRAWQAADRYTCLSWCHLGRVN